MGGGVVLGGGVVSGGVVVLGGGVMLMAATAAQNSFNIERENRLEIVKNKFRSWTKN